ncbi:MAG: dipeptide/oligopeptide/nickel ABC transporter permease/ATP-binding protein, partial [Chloroflexota bacterium]|nr:dipeptide/oligopeptide/nickel ABC transporter permease/ATP-binding protein [Chloroflexota bacterium]
MAEPEGKVGVSRVDEFGGFVDQRVAPLTTLRVAEHPVETDVAEPSEGLRRTRVWQRLRQQRLALIAAGYILLLCVVAIVGPWLAPYGPMTGDLRSTLQGPSIAHWLGTDHLGRDILSQIIYGTRLSMWAAFEAVLIAIILGVPIGLVAGYVGGKLDRVIMWGVDLVFALPPIMVALGIIAVLGTTLNTVMAAVGLAFSTRFVRLTRGMTLTEREELYVDGARVGGLDVWTIVSHHILPNIAPALIAQAALQFGGVLLIEATLSFLGIGASLEQPSWGRLLSQSRDYMEAYPFLAIPSGAAIMLAVLAFNLLGDGLHTALGRDTIVAERKTKRRNTTAEGVIARSAQRLRAVCAWQSNLQFARWGLLRQKPPRNDRGKFLSGGASNLVVAPREMTATDKLQEPALAIQGLQVRFPGTQDNEIVIVCDVSLYLKPCETLGLVGESGSGKSMTALAAMGLVPAPGWISQGSIRLGARELTSLSDSEMRRLRGKEMSIVFQDPFTSLNPSLTIETQLTDPLRIHLGLNLRQARERALELLALVQLADPQRRMSEYPHQLSGGMAQRVGLARALACRPSVLIADEPTSALDVTVQGQILDLLKDAQRKFGMAMLFITHDWGIVAELCDRVAVMYAGE